MNKPRKSKGRSTASAGWDLDPPARNHRAILRVVLLALVALSEAPNVGAIPAFTRQYDVPCHFCHDGYPHLFGYDIYLANTGSEVDNIGEHHDGVEVGGFIDDETHWSVSVVDARG